MRLTGTRALGMQEERSARQREFGRSEADALLCHCVVKLATSETTEPLLCQLCLLTSGVSMCAGGQCRCG